MIWQVTYKIKTDNKTTINCAPVLIETHEKNNSSHVISLFWSGIGKHVYSTFPRSIEIISVEFLGVVLIKD